MKPLENEDFFNNVMDIISQRFKISKREVQSFRFTGVDVAGLENGDVTISQTSYAESLEKVQVDSNDDCNRPLNKQEFKQYRGLVGKLTWLSEMTRPDLSYDTLDLAGYNKEATVKNLKAINKVVDKAKKVNGIVRYSRIGELSDLKILAISDGGLNRREHSRSWGKQYFCLIRTRQKYHHYCGNQRRSKLFVNRQRQQKPVHATKLWRTPFI